MRRCGCCGRPIKNKAGFPSTDVVSDLIAAMKNHVQVNLAVQDRDDEAAAREFLVTRGVTLDHVRFFRIPHIDLRWRDMGPQFTRNGNGQLRINDWNFSFWGYEEPAEFQQHVRGAIRPTGRPQAGDSRHRRRTRPGHGRPVRSRRGQRFAQR